MMFEMTGYALGQEANLAELDLATLKRLPVEEFFPERFRTPAFMEDLDEASKYYFLFWFPRFSQMSEVMQSILYAHFGETKGSAEERAPKVVGQFLAKYSLTAAPVYFNDGMATADESESNIATDPVLTLSACKLVDARKLDWDKLIEFRKDRDGTSKFRRFRGFLYENYVGKPASYVEDDILRRVEDYESTIKRWDFETVQGTLNTIFTSKILAGAVTGSFLASLMGAPLPAILSAAGGVSLEIGKSLIQLRGRKFTLREMLKDNPISYIVTAKALENETNSGESTKAL